MFVKQHHILSLVLWERSVPGEGADTHSAGVVWTVVAPSLWQRS
jgi:hypothetical protein